MVKQKGKHLNNFLQTIGRPVFKLLLFSIFLIGYLVLLFKKLNQITITWPSIGRSTPVIFVIPKSKPKHLFFTLSTISLILVTYLKIFHQLPNPRTLVNRPTKLTTQILDRRGNLLYKIYQDENRTPVSIKSLPKYVTDAVLSAEDKDFYFHHGFSLPGLLRALYRNIFDSHLEGGSTITQQLIKNTLLTSEKTLTRKTKEIILSIQTERLYSKDQILEMYLNQVGFGGTAYGIQEATQQYFGLNAQDLKLHQAAFLAGIISAPSKYSPFGTQPSLAKNRQLWVLDQMHANGQITYQELQNAKTEPLNFRTTKTEIKAPHFVMLVKDILIDQLGEQVVTQGGLKVYTTLDLSLQEKTQDIITSEVTKLKNLHVTNGAAVIVNPQTGEILSMVGSKDYFDLESDGQVNITLAKRQPGSAIKPLNYALYLEKGYSPASIINDSPITVRIPGQPSWSPKNYDGRFHGPVTIRQALASSYNIPSVLLLAQNGIPEFVTFAQSLGITTWDDPSRFGPSIALGSLEVRMVDLAAAYTAFANQGISTPLSTVIKIEYPSGQVIHLASCPSVIQPTSNKLSANASEGVCNAKRNLSPETAYLISDILSDNNARTPAFGSHSVLHIQSAQVAVKTGTSNDLKDNWTVGYTPRYLVVTWVGNNDNTPMSRIASGVTGASPIWARVFQQILSQDPSSPKFLPTNNLVAVPICTLTGTLSCFGCPTKVEYFVRGSEPTKVCNPDDIAKKLNSNRSPTTPPTI